MKTTLFQFTPKHPITNELGKPSFFIAATLGHCYDDTYMKTLVEFPEMSPKQIKTINKVLNEL